MASKSGLRFTLEDYRLMLKPWKTSVPLDLRYDSIARTHPKKVETTNKETEQLFGSVLENERIGDQTIDLLDTSIDSIPETPEYVLKHEESKKSKSDKRNISSFFDLEAEDDSSGDEIEECREQDIYSQTDIDDSTQRDSQPIGQYFNDIDSRDAKDMHSVYLRSVKNRMEGKYLLQYEYDRTVDVYSQEPNEEELMDYQMDSFCVPNDCVVFEEPENTETAVDSSKRTKRLRSSKKKYKRIIFSP